MAIVDKPCGYVDNPRYQLSRGFHHGGALDSFQSTDQVFGRGEELRAGHWGRTDRLLSRRDNANLQE